MKSTSVIHEVNSNLMSNFYEYLDHQVVKSVVCPGQKVIEVTQQKIYLYILMNIRHKHTKIEANFYSNLSMFALIFIIKNYYQGANFSFLSFLLWRNSPCEIGLIQGIYGTCTLTISDTSYVGYIVMKISTIGIFYVHT